MESSKEKHIKEQLNEVLQTSCKDTSDKGSKEDIREQFPDFSKISSDTALEQSLSSKSFQRIKDIFEKTEAMKEVAKEKNHQLEQQFKCLKQKLSSSSACLLRIKNNIENLKFSYQKNVIDMHNALDPSDYFDEKINPIKTKEEMAEHMENIRKKIDDLQSRMTVQREKQQHVTESYQAAFDKVVNTLQQIEEGSYSCQDLTINNNN